MKYISNGMKPEEETVLNDFSIFSFFRNNIISKFLYFSNLGIKLIDHTTYLPIVFLARDKSNNSTIPVLNF